MLPFATIGGDIIAGLILALIVAVVGSGLRLGHHLSVQDRRIGKRLDQQDAALDTIRGEVQTNGGQSLKDAVLKQGVKLDAHLEQAAYQQIRFDQHLAQQAQK